MNRNCPQVLLLDFQLTPPGGGIVIARSPFPSHPNRVVAVYDASAFGVPGGLEVKVDLLRSFEREFGDWQEQSGPLVSNAANSTSTDSLEATWLLSVDKLKSIAQLHRSIDLFVKAAWRLDGLARKAAGGTREKPD